MTWEQAQQEALARANTSEILLSAVELRHSLFPGPVRLIDHDVDVDVPLEASAPVDGGTTQTFVGTGMRAVESDQTNQPDPTTQVELDGVSGTLLPFLRPAVVSGEPVEVTTRGLMYDASTGSVAQMLRVFHLQLRSYTATMTQIAAIFAYTNAASQPFPAQKYDAVTNPGLV